MAFKRETKPVSQREENDRQAKNKRLKPFTDQNGKRIPRGKSFFYYPAGEPRKVDGNYGNNSRAQLALDNASKRSKASRTKVRAAA